MASRRLGRLLSHIACDTAPHARPGIDPLPLLGKVALVTGGSRGIGKAVSLGLAQRGASVAVIFRADGAAAAQTLNELPSGAAGQRHQTFQCDVADPAAVEKVVASCCTELGGLDILINNAGIFIDHDILDPAVSYAAWQDAWRKTTAANLIGPANLAFCAARSMVQRKVEGGRIVQVSSRGAYRGEPTSPAYGASKAALNQLTQSLAKALGSRGISVAAVAPGFVETEMARKALEGPNGPMIKGDSSWGRVARVEEVAEAVLFLCSPGATFSTGAVVDVNGASYLR